MADSTSNATCYADASAPGRFRRDPSANPSIMFNAPRTLAKTDAREFEFYWRCVRSLLSGVESFAVLKESIGSLLLAFLANKMN